MKKSIYRRAISALGLAAVVALSPGNIQAQATWTSGAGDNDWNSALNWDLGVPAEGTNATIGAGNTVNYNTPMVAGSFGSLALTSSILNVNAAGFTSSAAWTVSGVAARLFVNSGGVAAVTNGSLTFTANGGGTITSGGSLTLQSQLNMGTSGAGNNGFFTNNGGILSAVTTRINPNNLSSSSVLMINGGTNDLGNVSIFRSSASSFLAIGAEGLVISNGLVRMTSLSVGGFAANSHLSAVMVAGTVTNTGSFLINQITSGRAARFLQLGGLFVSTDPTGARVAVTNAGSVGIYSVLGGTNILEKFVLGDLTNNSGSVNLTNAAKIYIGSGGMVSNLIQTVNVALNSGGTFGANADWTGGVSILLAGGSFDCADLAGVAHNITITNVLRGTAALTKTGGGILSLNVANLYSGNTLVNQGTLTLGAAGSIASSPQIVLASGTTFDVTAVAGYTLAAARTITGLGTVSGPITVASGGIINPGSSTGTLTLANALTEAGGAINHFDLPTTPGPGNDKLLVNGDLNLTGVNTLEIVGGGAPGSVHTLIQYGGNFNGSLANFSISGATGSLSNNASTKTISLIIASAVRTATNVVWLGNAVNNDWDTVNRTNWQNTGTGLLDYFVTGDNVLFNATGAVNPNVNIVGNVSPATVTVGAAANYTLGGSGAIGGSSSLTKTNTGTLIVNSTNSYTGVTTIAGGVLEVSQLAIGGLNSAIGAANVSPANLVFDGGTLRYSGVSVSIDRAATFNNGGAGIDISSGATALTISGASIGTGKLTKSGVGQLTLAGGSSYSGGTIISNGVLQLNTTAAAGTGGITNYGATLRVNGVTTEDNQLDFNGLSALELSGVGAGNIPLRGAWTGNGTVNVNFLTQNASQTFSIGGEGAGGGHMWDFTGTVDFGTNQGFARLNNNSTFNLGSSNATFNLGSSTLIFVQRNGGTTTHLGALLGGPNTRLSGARNDVGGITSYSIGGKNLDTVFQGMITNGQSGSSIRPAAIIKVGTGKLTLTGLSPHTGATTVTAGTLQVDGAVTASPITVTGGTLAGIGSIGGAVDVQFDAILAPGDAGIGQLTIGSLTLGFGSTNYMEIHKANATNDSVVGLTSVNYGGNLVVNNLGGTLSDGDTYKLFDATPGSYAGAFDTITLPALGANLFWDTTSLTIDGTIRVYTPRPAVTAFGIDGSNFYLTGTNGGNTSTHYVVVTSTNVAAPAGTWTPLVTNTFAFDGTMAFTNAVNVAQPARFFRLKTP